MLDRMNMNCDILDWSLKCSSMISRITGSPSHMRRPVDPTLEKLRNPSFLLEDQTQHPLAHQKHRHHRASQISLCHDANYTTQEPSSPHTQSHSPKTHHLALRSASTNPLQTPLSPILIIVSQMPPSAASSVLTQLSGFFNNRMIFPLGA